MKFRGEHFPDECRCSQCWSLAEFMRAETGKHYGLRPAQGHPPLRVVHACSGEYTCTCERCSEDRKRRVDKGSRRLRIAA